MTDDAHEAMRALAGAVCPECQKGFDEITKFTDPEAIREDTLSFGGRAVSTWDTLITVHPCGCRITQAQYADLKRRLRR